jgi:alkylhydroperoxidase family enzyme
LGGTLAFADDIVNQMTNNSPAGKRGMALTLGQWFSITSEHPLPVTETGPHASSVTDAASPHKIQRRTKNMFDFLFERIFRKQEEVTGESMDFVRDLRRASPGGFWRFAGFTPMAKFRRALPKDACAVAKIAAAKSEDCGPCLQTTVNLARHDGVDDAIIRAAVTGDMTAMDERIATAYAFACAVCEKDFASEELRPKLIEWWGETGVAELALAICSTRLFPTLKRGLGHAQACHRISVGQETVIITRHARDAA